MNHTILGGRVQLYKRDDGRFWQCSASIKGRQFRATTGEEELSLAKDVAEDWYLGLRGKLKTGQLKTEKTFSEAAELFEKEYGVITEGQRSPRWVAGHQIRLRVHLTPFFGDLGVSEVTAGKVQEYRVHRMTPRSEPNPHSKSNRKHKAAAPSRSTIHNEIVTLRQVLKTALRHAWLDHLPDLSAPYRTQGKVVHRPWFSPEEYKQLYEATREYARACAGTRVQWNAEQVHDYVLFMANTGMRPDEAKNLQHRDVKVVKDEAMDKKILEIEVRGKRGVGYCKSTPSAVIPYQRLLAREKQDHRTEEDKKLKKRPINESKPQPTDLVFPGNHIKLFNNLLHRANLKTDRDKKPRTAYSLRHTYICLRLMEGADIYQVAKNCRTSVEMIEKHYAAHIKTTIDAASLNVLKPKRPSRKSSKAKNDFESAAGHS